MADADEMSVMMSTDQGDRLKTAFESMRDFVNEVALAFKKEGIELMGYDKARVVLVRYALPAKRIRETGGTYEHNADGVVKVGIKTKFISTVLKCSSPGDTVSIGVYPNVPGRIVLTVQNGAKYTKWEIVTPDVPDDDMLDDDAIDTQKYSGAITMSSTLFHDMIRDLATARDPSLPEPVIVKLCCDGARLVLSSEGLMARVAFEVTDCRASTDGKATASFAKNDEGAWPVCESFVITFLQRIAKAKNLCSRITMHVRPDFPAAFVYDSPIGTLTYIVVPRDDDVEKKMPAPLAASGASLASTCERSSKKRPRSPAPVKNEDETVEEEEDDDAENEDSEKSSDSEDE